MSRRKKRCMEPIDITPLIDVLFMLIIFLVLTTSFVQGRVDVRLPQGGASAESAPKSILLSVTKDGAILWEGQAVRSADLIARLKPLRLSGTEVQIAGDAEVPYGAVAELLDLLRTHGIESASLLFEGASR